MNGRSLHDALLRVLADAPLREALLADPARAAAVLGSEEADVLARADHTRLSRLSRFMARHFYRERLVRLYRHARAALLRVGRDPLRLLDDDAFRALLGDVTLGSPGSAELVASRAEERCRAEAESARREGAEVAPYLEDLLRYGGTLFRVEAGPRRWGGGFGAETGGDGGRGAGAPGPALSPWARVVELDHDLPPILDAVEDPARPLPEAARRRVRLLAALDPRGSVHVVACPDPVARLLPALDGRRPLPESAAAAGLSPAQAEIVVRQLRDLGALVP